MKRTTNAKNVAQVVSALGLALGLSACSADEAPSDGAMMPTSGVSGAAGAAGVAGVPATTGGVEGVAGTAAGMTSVVATGGTGTENTGGMTAGAIATGGMMAATGGSAGAAGAPALDLEPFSFFVTSLRAMRELSGSQDGFGGDLTYGETGVGAGLRGADKICTEIAEQSMPGSGAKEWRAFLSAVAASPDGGPVHAKDRIGAGPWYDRLGRLVSNNLTELIAERPTTADPAIIDDLPNEDGVPNHDPDGTGQVDNHDFLTGSNDLGEVYKMDMRVTCDDWTKSLGVSTDAPRVGHSWPRRGFGTGGTGGGFQFPGFDGGTFPGGGDINMVHWISSLDEAGCGAGIELRELGPPMESNPTVGSGGGYGGIYCFALQP